MKESKVGRQIRKAFGLDPAVKIFRNNVGLFRSLTGDRRVRCGLIKGSSDYIGWTIVIVTPEMVGKRVAVFTAIETKAPKKGPSKFQQNFINTVKWSGGFAGVARSVEDAREITHKR